jgi:hypothetical protein
MLRSNVYSTAVPNGTVTGNVAKPCEVINIQSSNLGLDTVGFAQCVPYGTVPLKTVTNIQPTSLSRN